MSLELGIWRIGKDCQPISVKVLEYEDNLEDMLDADITIASPNWMIIGRQVRTSFNKEADLLVIDRDGNLAVLELKRDKTYRDIVAQTLDYGSWVCNLESEDIARIFEEYLNKYHSERKNESINEAFCKRFLVQQMPEELNQSHELVIVCSALDDSTERIVNYLAEYHQVKINAVFFRVFEDEGRRYLGRVWLRDPSEVELSQSPQSGAEIWNGEYYVSFGEGGSRHWKDAVDFGFVSAGYGRWYTNTLQKLEPGARIWVNVPGYGYVGVGKVTNAVVKVDKFMVKQNGVETPITKLKVSAPKMFETKDDPDNAEYLVGVNWIKTVPVAEAIKEKGFFGNQNTVATPTSPKWQHTVERLKKRFGI